MQQKEEENLQRIEKLEAKLAEQLTSQVCDRHLAGFLYLLLLSFSLSRFVSFFSRLLALLTSRPLPCSTPQVTESVERRLGKLEAFLSTSLEAKMKDQMGSEVNAKVAEHVRDTVTQALVAQLLAWCSRFLNNLLCVC